MSGVITNPERAVTGPPVPDRQSDHQMSAGTATSNTQLLRSSKVAGGRYDVDMKTDSEEQFRQAILKADTSRYALSKATGVSQATLSLFVHRKTTITLETAAKLAVALGLKITTTTRTGRKPQGR